VFFSWNACGKMQVNRPVQHKTNSTIKQTIMNNAIRDKRTAIEIQIGVVRIMSVTINLYMNHIQSTKMYIKVITNTLLFLIHLKVKETIILLQTITLRTLKIQTPKIIAMYMDQL
jgi:hypothetical protein